MKESKPTGSFKYLKLEQMRHQREALLMEAPEALRMSCQQRQNEWMVSRWVLLNLLSDQGLNLPWSSLGEVGLRHLTIGYQNWDVSISHSEDLGGAWLCERQASQQIGYDLETKFRSLSPLLESKIRRDDDLRLSAIHLWSLKEAIFKSLPHLLQIKVSPIDIWIQGEDHFQISTFDCVGKWFQITDELAIQSFATTPLKP